MVTDRARQNSDVSRNMECGVKSGCSGSAWLTRAPVSLGLVTVAPCPSEPSQAQPRARAMGEHQLSSSGTSSTPTCRAVPEPGHPWRFSGQGRARLRPFWGRTQQVWVAAERSVTGAVGRRGRRAKPLAPAGKGCSVLCLSRGWDGREAGRTAPSQSSAARALGSAPSTAVAPSLPSFRLPRRAEGRKDSAQAAHPLLRGTGAKAGCVPGAVPLSHSTTHTSSL